MEVSKQIGYMGCITGSSYRQRVEQEWQWYLYAIEATMRPALTSGGSLTFKLPIPQHGDTWGRWKFNADDFTLEFIVDGGRYCVDLEKCNNSGQILDWLCQLLHKNWTTAEDIGFLLMAIDDIFGRLQAKICSFGANKFFDTSEFLSKRYPKD